MYVLGEGAEDAGSRKSMHFSQTLPSIHAENEEVERVNRMHPPLADVHIVEATLPVGQRDS